MIMITTTSKQIFATLFVLLLYLTLATEASSPTYIGSYCNNNTTYLPNSTLNTNLNVLLNSLTTNASQQQDGYYMTIMGFGTTSAVNGNFLCRGDINTTTCQNCVTDAAKQIKRRCNNQTEAVIWYEECLIRYTNRYFKFYSIEPRLNPKEGRNVSGVDFDRFNESVIGLLNDLAVKAANSGTAKKFATGNVKITRKGMRVYGSGQCITDLTSGQCETCLRNAIGTLPQCCRSQQGAAAMLASCIVRYQLYPFYITSSSGKNGVGTKAILIIVFLAILPVLLLILGCYCQRRRSRQRRRAMLKENFGDELKTLESLQFSFATIEAATNKFSHVNEIGKGGFGVVYKGVLSDGREIAVKKLSLGSGQGSIEFQNEILLIAKLQHRNLVTLLGFCLEEREKMLIYEYVPNKSLDYFLFDSERHRVLHWFERYKIIGGIARGILYLHEYSRLKVIHRDLKPSNVLLDNNMNPKISDFGLARIVAIDQEQGRTNRIVGTYGYMSPEYAMHGQFSEKSDVFSFGVIILEIVSGKRNSRPIESHDFEDLIRTAWRQWRNQTPLEMLDPILKESFTHSEVIKCIQLGLLCVQENPDDRPTMAQVVSYLSSLLVELPLPQEPPASSMDRGMKLNIKTNESSSGQFISHSNSTSSSINDMTKSQFFPR
ncbi:unnamed protein product [Trifolium pratense]|uniref:Uncharacterized protein n=1 Tax=Trifolium pratense TaxID=57577 RepID=A0ACB0K4A3_TRIPR|nr:unnamed protein product [Trifolium pratense]